MLALHYWKGLKFVLHSAFISKTFAIYTAGHTHTSQLTTYSLKPLCISYPGQFWNVPVTAVPFDPPAGSFLEGNESLFSVTVDPMDGGATRSFLGDLFPRTWDNTRENCLYVGNGQGGPGGEFAELPDSVIKGRYSDYAVDSLFDTDFEYDRINTCAA